MSEKRPFLLGDYPLEMNAELRYILGTPVFHLAGVFMTLRAAGHEIPRRFEDEQAATIFWMLEHYARSGPDGWRAAADADLQRMRAKVVTMADAAHKTEDA